MIIHPVTRQCEHGQICVAARIELEKPPYNLPEFLWFKFPEAQVSFVSDYADGFVLALLYLAQVRGENIHVRGTLSPRLCYGINEYQRIRNLRDPRRYQPIEISADRYIRRESSGDNILSLFSGGIDSFYTLWTHLPQNEKYAGNSVTHALFVQGFDFGLHQTAMFEICRAAYSRMLGEWDVALLTASTNVRSFVLGNWSKAVSPVLLGLAHIIGRSISRVYMPAEYSYTEGLVGIASALQYGLLSSEGLEVLNDGSRISKFDRIAAMAQVPATYNTLRVCYTRPDGLMNCCECGKCINTMTALEICGTLKNYSTFPKPLTHQRIRAAHSSYAALPIYLSSLRGTLSQHRYDLALDTGIMLLQNSFRWGAHALKKRFAKPNPPNKTRTPAP